MAVRGLLPLASMGALILVAGCPHRSPYPLTGADDRDGGIDEADATVIPPVLADAAVIPDARPGGTPDARPGGGGGIGIGGMTDFPTCVSDAECAPGHDCRTIPWLGSEKQCIPACDTTTDCPFNTFCYPTGGGWLGPAFALMGDHCWYSLCGEALGPSGMPLSVTGGGCQLGAEAGLPLSETLPGWCFPIDDQYIGQCLEVGGVPPGGACEFASPTRSTPNCNASSLCIGQSGYSTGTCRRQCAPQHILNGGATGCTTGEECLDSSQSYVYSDGTITRSTIGFCTDVEACGLIGPNTCGPSVDGQAQGCIVTNPVRPTGICDPTGTGGLMPGSMCPAPPTSDAYECPHGTLCDSAGSGTCETICKRAHYCAGDPDCPAAMSCMGSICTLPYGSGPDAACPGGTSCEGLLWDFGFDSMIGTADDVYTFDWGTCR